MEDYLADLFTQYDAAKERVHVLEGRIKAVGAAYSKDKGYLVPLALDRLRCEINREKDNLASKRAGV